MGRGASGLPGWVLTRRRGERGGEAGEGKSRIHAFAGWRSQRTRGRRRPSSRSDWQAEACPTKAGFRREGPYFLRILCHRLFAPWRLGEKRLLSWLLRRSEEHTSELQSLRHLV